VRCDRVARGVTDALGGLKSRLPVVVRLQGTNAAEGRRIIQEAGLGFLWADTLQDAARMAVDAVSGGTGGGR
jgi:succinyl-CoA synthetase beta subunit